MIPCCQELSSPSYTLGTVCLDFVHAMFNFVGCVDRQARDMLQQTLDAHADARREWNRTQKGNHYDCIVVAPLPA